MEPIESSETSAYNNTLTPGTYRKEKKLRIPSLRKDLMTGLFHYSVYLENAAAAIDLQQDYHRSGESGSHLSRCKGGNICIV